MRFDRTWDKFKGGPARLAAKEMRVTISRKGEIYMNQRAYEMLSKPAAVEMFYSREHDSIALVRSDPRQAENFMVSKKQTGWIIQGASFCRHYRIRINDTERFISPVIDNSGRMILNLRETVNVGGVQRRKKGEV